MIGNFVLLTILLLLLGLALVAVVTRLLPTNMHPGAVGYHRVDINVATTVTDANGMVAVTLDDLTEILEETIQVKALGTIVKGTPAANFETCYTVATQGSSAVTNVIDIYFFGEKNTLADDPMLAQPAAYATGEFHVSCWGR